MATEYGPNNNHYDKAVYASVPQEPTGSKVVIADDTEYAVPLNGIRPNVVWIHAKFDVYYSFVNSGTLADGPNQLFALAGSTPIARGGNRIENLRIRRAEAKIGTVHFTLSN